MPVPCAALTLLMLGPGTTITHAAIRALADNGCLVFWTGEQGVRFYAQGMGETRSARNLLHQARLWADPALRLQVVMRMYRMRFAEPLDESLTLRQLRGKEGIRVCEAYARASRETGVPWSGRSYRREQRDAADPVNRAFVCEQLPLRRLPRGDRLGGLLAGARVHPHRHRPHARGGEPMLSFVYDVADLYKADLTIPIAFRVVAETASHLERRTRQACRDAFHSAGLLQRIVPDVESALAVSPAPGQAGADFDADEALPGGLWDPEAGEVPGGVNQADVQGEE